jgi:hypothetical protein
MSRSVTPRTTLESLKREAKRWYKAIRAGEAEARARLQQAYPQAPDAPSLRDVQHALALEFGCPGWTALKTRLAEDAPIRRYDRVAEALVTAYRTPDESAMRIVWEYFGHMRTWDVMRRYVRLDLGRHEQPQSPEDDEITMSDARYLVARAQGFESWQALESYAASMPPSKTLAAKAVAAFSRSTGDELHDATRSRDWDEIETAIRERQLTGFAAAGQMTDALLRRFSRLDHLTTLDLSGSKQLTDAGLRYLAQLPRLRRLNLAGCGGITDRGLAVLQHLPHLESINLSWNGITDAGAANLAANQNLEVVDLGATPTGDGAIRALAGKARLRDFRSGNGITDAGLPGLHDLPAFKTWQGSEPPLGLLEFSPDSSFLMLRGSFTNAGFAHLVGLDGLFGLNVDSSQLAITGAALAPLVNLPHLGWLAFDAKDESMPYIAALPHLRFLMCQDTAAGDDGFVALSRSRSIEVIWGRRCHNLQRRGFTALADMPSLRSLSVSCLNVDDEGVAALPRFPALRELMPMDVPDEGYRHIGGCERLESLVLMYCRDTGDRATGHLRGLAHLRKYFASYNRITDRTPEILSAVPSLEEVEFDACAGLTNTGVAALAALPRLRQLRVSGMPRVTRDVVNAFRDDVRVRHSV